MTPVVENKHLDPWSGTTAKVTEIEERLNIFFFSPSSLVRRKGIRVNRWNACRLEKKEMQTVDCFFLKT